MKLKLFSVLLFSLIITTAAVAQNDENWQSKDYKVGDFSAVSLDGSFRVYLIQGDEYGIKVKSNNSDAFENIKINNYSGKVTISINQSIFEYSRISLYITFKTLNELNIEGGVNLKTNGYLDLTDFAVNVEGGANIELNCRARQVKVVGEGGFIFELKGVAETLDVSISGAGHVSASDLKTDNVKFNVRGFGTGSVFAVNTLNVKLEGVGMIKYKGNPKVTESIDGLGSVKPLN